MELKLRITNNKDAGVTLIWPSTGKVYMAGKEQQDFNIDIIPTTKEIAKYKSFLASYESKEFDLAIVTDLPIVKAEKQVSKVEVLKMMQKESPVVSVAIIPEKADSKERILDKNRFTEGRVADFQSPVVAIDDNKPPMPITVELFKDSGVKLKEPETVMFAPDSANAAYRKNSENVFAPQTMQEAVVEQRQIFEGPMSAASDVVVKKTRKRKQE